MSINRSISIDRSINQSICQSINQSINMVGTWACASATYLSPLPVGGMGSRACTRAWTKSPICSVFQPFRSAGCQPNNQPTNQPNKKTKKQTNKQTNKQARSRAQDAAMVQTQCIVSRAYLEHSEHRAFTCCARCNCGCCLAHSAIASFTADVDGTATGAVAACHASQPIHGRCELTSPGVPYLL